MHVAAQHPASPVERGDLLRTGAEEGDHPVPIRQGIGADVDHRRARLDEVGGHDGRTTHRRDQHVGPGRDPRQVDGPGMADRDRGVAVQQQHCHRLADDVAAADDDRLAALDLDTASFDQLFEGHLSSLRVINYPEQTRPPLPGQLRAGAHSDYGVLTILATDDAPGGLEVLKRDGSWCAVPHVAGTFVVNIGDAMMRWTDDHWVSTQHRVINPPQDSTGPTRRQSIAYFHNLPRDTIIECLEPFRQAGRRPKYPPITYGEYAALRYRQAHGEDKNLDL